MTYQPMSQEQIAAVMAGAPLTEAHFYDMIEESLNEPAECHLWPYYTLDFVASREEWAAFKAAMTRWMADKDREYAEGFDNAEAEEREERHLHPAPDPPA
jgi:hypothetical protein